jgi:hypothetical protein
MIPAWRLVPPGHPLFSFHSEVLMRLFTAVAAAVCALLLTITFTMAANKAEPVTSTSGILIDQACGAKMMDKDDPEKAAAGHTKECATKESCEKSGYAVISGKHMYKFNEKGNVLAKEFLKKTDKESDLRVRVDGAIKGDEILVDGIVAEKDHK